MTYRQTVRVTLEFEIETSTVKALATAVASIKKDLPDTYNAHCIDKLGVTRMRHVKPKRKEWEMGSVRIVI